ncbi:DUF445 family protein [Ihubacter massiliensis]|uniref:DUF445 family protein n=1 Tax=Hominibacterium faecale TaxID=2839743 RepID=A0A9J6QUF2_9FIRM|nr:MULTISPECIES: DUF445 family protein [Eubacteriales Family XIII. Incertae Sedis]MCI7300597.1 DUF445 family protein [Clostridia bacterium]MDE8734244.1 DUF445 family protein [Eubacteriales bacterium DFI.9.88]MDY3010278.1 DUF445 family protein [Clostridiales Family XIII bacterium]MCO7121445.1 DUF445 family protein [Ihubacter massiliensis]MCU7378431.1 DUF445 family protein [Hominibacterium faecale]
MLILKLIAGPLIGALIGYCTNFIAVKMLFKPHRPIMIGKRRLPFTPGLIPKRKDELAGAIGSAIGEVLLTKKDLAEALPAEHIKESITGGLWEAYLGVKESQVSIGEAARGYLSEERLEEIRFKLEDVITERVMSGIEELDISNIVVTEGSRAIREKVQGTMLAMMVNDQVIQSVAAPIGEEIENYISENGEDKIRPVVQKELNRVGEETIGSLTQQLSLEQPHMKKIVDGLYSACVEDAMEEMVEKIDVAAIVEEKVRDMDVAKLEALILSVMKKELNAIVNLGALIGLVIGLLNLLINMLG